VLSPERIEDYADKKNQSGLSTLPLTGLSLKKLGFTHPLDPTEKGKPSCEIQQTTFTVTSTKSGSVESSKENDRFDVFRKV
jgi:hypothetical protein